MAKQNNEENRQVDVEYIQEKLNEGYKYTQEAKGRDLVLVIGNTGVGKSTTCNYLFGYPMKEAKHRGMPVIETVNTTNIKIGHEVMSETLYAKSILAKSIPSTSESNTHICLLDCPGFLGNRTIEEKVIESISTELAIRNARQIKGILILISLNVLRETRVGEVRELVKTLISLFKDPVEMVQYSIFIITKKSKYMPSKEAEEITMGAMESLKEYCKEQASRLYKNQNLSSAENLTHIDYDKIATYFTTVLEKRSNIIFVDPLDNGESKKLIFDRINGIEIRKKGFFKEIAKTGINLAKKVTGLTTDEVRPITIDDFNFSEYDDHRILFNKALYHLAGDGYNLMRKIRQEAENIPKLHLEISDAKERLNKLHEEQSDIKQNLRKTAEGKSDRLKKDCQAIRNWELMIDRNNRRIKSKRKEVDAICVAKKKLNEDLECIDNNEPLIFVEKSIYRNVSWWKVFGWEEMEFNADTRDSNVPIIDVDLFMENGEWNGEVDERNAGHYQITYQSEYLARPANARVTTYIKTKDEEGNQINIERIKDDIGELAMKKDDLESDINDLENSNKIFNSNIEEVKTSAKGYEDTMKRELERCTCDITFYGDEIAKQEAAAEKTKISGLTNISLFDKDQRKYDILINISTLLKFPSSLINLFVSEYKVFLPNVNNYRSCFDEKSAINLDSISNEEEKISGMEDPLTGKEIKDLVVTSAGTVFDKHSLLKQFDTSNSDNVPPFFFKHESGLVEKIEYRGWNEMSKQQYQKLILSHSTTSESLSSFTKSEIDQMTIEQLKEQSNKLVQEIETMKAQVEVKETELEKIYQKLKKLDLKTKVKVPVEENNAFVENGTQSK